MRKTIAFIKEVLYMKHFNERIQTPLTQFEIAETIGVSQSTFCRRKSGMLPGGMEAYREAFKQNRLKDEFRATLSDGSIGIDRIVDAEFDAGLDD